jgi:stage V sporulation protein G
MEWLDCSGIIHRAGGIVEITEIRLTLRNEEKLKAFANVTFDNAFVIRGLKVINGNRGFFLSMPSKRRPDGTYQDIAHPVTSRMRRLLEERVLEAYEKEVARKVQGQGMNVSNRINR